MMTAVVQHPVVRCLQPKSAQSAVGKGPLYADRMYTATVLYVDMSGTISTLYDGLIVPEHFPDV